MALPNIIHKMQITPTNMLLPHFFNMLLIILFGLLLKDKNKKVAVPKTNTCLEKLRGQFSRKTF
jgi:hypothetical protein